MNQNWDSIKAQTKNLDDNLKQVFSIVFDHQIMIDIFYYKYNKTQTLLNWYWQDKKKSLLGLDLLYDLFLIHIDKINAKVINKYLIDFNAKHSTIWKNDSKCRN